MTLQSTTRLLFKCLIVSGSLSIWLGGAVAAQPYAKSTLAAAQNEEERQRQSTHDNQDSLVVTVSDRLRLVSVEAVNVDVRDLFAEVSRKLDTPITVIDVERRPRIPVTVSFQRRSLSEAIEVIAGRLPITGYIVFEANTDPTPATSKYVRIYLLGRTGTSPPGTVPRLIPHGVALRDPEAPAEPLAYLRPGTEFEILWSRNHQALGDVQRDINTYFSELRKAIKTPVPPPRPDVRPWARALYADALLTQLLELGLDEPGARSLLEELQDPLAEPEISLIAESLPSTSKYYPAALRKLMGSAFAKPLSDMTDQELRQIAMRAQDLVARRKRYADKLYRQNIQAHFSRTDVTVQEKLTYLTPFLLDGELRLVHYGIKTLESLGRRSPISSEDRQAIEIFRIKVIERGKSP